MMSKPSPPNGKVVHPSARTASARPTPPPVYRPQPEPRYSQPKVTPLAPPIIRQPRSAPSALQTAPNVWRAKVAAGRQLHPTPPGPVMPHQAVSAAGTATRHGVNPQPTRIPGATTPANRTRVAPPPAWRGPTPAVQMVRNKPKKKPTGSSISSETNPDLDLANRLEQNTSLTSPRLITKRTKKKMLDEVTVSGYLKYMLIPHRNLTDDSGLNELTLAIPLNYQSKVGSRRHLHYQQLMDRAKKKNQTARQRTEMVGETVATLHMEQLDNGQCKLLVGYGKGGTGIDQLWINHTKKVYYVVEAKGPNAILKTNQFAVRGLRKGKTSCTQMGNDWVSNRLAQLKNSHSDVFDDLLNNCGLMVEGTFLVTDPDNDAEYCVKGLVITAEWDTETGDLYPSISNRQTYDFN